MANEAARLEQLPLGAVRPHPKNPRVSLREDVVEAIRVSLAETGAMSAEYAIRVRPVDGGHEIISGHHRHEAAKRAGLETVPAWVKEMTDDEAYMALVMDNRQGELSPLEIGIHALEVVGRGERGRGKKGGLNAYARELGKDGGYVRSLAYAAEVAKIVGQPTILGSLIDKTQHLYAIHSADPSLWEVLVKAMLAKGWSVKDTEHWVGKVKDFEIDDSWAVVFLPRPGVVARFLERLEFSPQTVRRLQLQAETTEAMVSDLAGASAPGLLDEYRAWLAAGVGSYSWDLRKLIERHREIEESFAERKDAGAWLLGRWEDHVGSLGDGSAAMLLTDPPYGMAFQSDRRTDRRAERRHEPIEGDGDDAVGLVRETLAAFLPKLKPDAHVYVFCHWSNEPEVRDAVRAAGLKIRGSLIWGKNAAGMGDPKTTHAPMHERIIHAVKGSPVLFERTPDLLLADRVPADRHPTEKPVDLLARLIEAATVAGELVIDPFGGVASTAAAAKGCGRLYWSCEQDEDYHRSGEERLRQ